jgi:hypothetical protein
MAIDLTQKRCNWLNAGMVLLFGPQGRQGPVPQVLNGGLYAATIALQAWTAEGVLAGFLPNGNTPAPCPVLDSDFAAYPNIDAAIFMNAAAALGTLNADYLAVVAALVAIKP